MSFARSWDDLKAKMNPEHESIELERVKRIQGKKGTIYSAFQLPVDMKKIRIWRVRFGVMWDCAQYNYNHENNTIIVLGDYKKNRNSLQINFGGSI